jgi:hypothetical protein
MKLTVLFAVWGALPGGIPNEAKAYNVKAQLQSLIDANDGVVSINDDSFGDPAPGNVKHFGAIVERNGRDYFFACQEDQQIDFKSGGIA